MQINTRNLIHDLGNFENRRRYKESLSKLKSHIIIQSCISVNILFINCSWIQAYGSLANVFVSYFQGTPKIFNTHIHYLVAIFSAMVS
jgi:hypothetical protein